MIIIALYTATSVGVKRVRDRAGGRTKEREAAEFGRGQGRDIEVKEEWNKVGGTWEGEIGRGRGEERERAKESDK